MKTLSIIIPVYNEAATVVELVTAVLQVKLPRIKKELIIIDDASQDTTLPKLKRLIKRATSPRHTIKLLRNPRNLGKGASVKQGLLHCTGDIVILQDADLEYDPQDYPRLISPILNNQAEVVYGSRFLGGSEHRVLFFWHSTMNHLLTLFSNMITNLNLTDMACCSKAFRGDLIRTIAPRLSSPRFGLESEITARLAKLSKIRIYEVQISYIGRSYSEGKHIRWWDGVKAIGQIVYYNWFSA
jgi:glycosyltransferase involved in cell wall biosynthesis